jgi:DNA gyrase inhibitor GyrI
MIGAAFGRLVSNMEPAIVAPDEYPRYMAIYYDNPQEVAPAELRSDACVVVGEDYRPADGIHIEEIAGGSYARWTHIGPYSEMGTAWQAFMAELASQHIEIQPAPPLEAYMNDHNETPADMLVTDLFVKVAGPQL